MTFLLIAAIWLTLTALTTIAVTRIARTRADYPTMPLPEGFREAA